MRKNVSLKLGGGFCTLLNALPDHPVKKNEILDIFYNGLTTESRDYLDSCAGCVFRERTVEQAQELLNNLLKNADDWTLPEPPPKPTPKKRGILFLSPEDMQEAKKSMKEKGIKAEDVKNLPPIEEIHGLDPPKQVVEVNSLYKFDEGDIPYNKSPSQCLDEFDNFVVKQQNFNMQISDQLKHNAIIIERLSDVLVRISNDVKGLCKHFSMVHTQLEQVSRSQHDLFKRYA